MAGNIKFIIICRGRLTTCITKLTPVGSLELIHAAADDIINIYICLLTGNYRSNVDLVLENHWQCPILQKSMQKLRSTYTFFTAMSVIHAADFNILADIKWPQIYSGQ